MAGTGPGNRREGPVYEKPETPRPAPPPADSPPERACSTCAYSSASASRCAVKLSTEAEACRQAGHRDWRPERDVPPPPAGMRAECRECRDLAVLRDKVASLEAEAVMVNDPGRSDQYVQAGPTAYEAGKEYVRKGLEDLGRIGALEEELAAANERAEDAKRERPKLYRLALTNGNDARRTLFDAEAPTAQEALDLLFALILRARSEFSGPAAAAPPAGSTTEVTESTEKEKPQ